MTVRHKGMSSCIIKWFEPPHDKSKKTTCAPSEDSDQPGHPPNLISVFVVRMKEAWVLRYPLSAQRRLRPDWADAQADLSLRWAHRHFVGFVMRRLVSVNFPFVVLDRMLKYLIITFRFYFILDSTKPTKLSVRPAKTPISLGICPV